MLELSTPLILIALLIGVTVLLITALGRWRRQRVRASLARNEHVLARWRVDVDLWRAWREYEPSLRAQDRRRNELHDHQLPDDGFNVVVGRSAIEIDNHVHLLPLRGTPEIQNAEVNDARVRPSYLELTLKYPEGGAGASGVPQSAMYSVLRIPVPTSALAEARAVAAHYNGDVPGTPDFFHGTGDGTNPEDLAVCWTCGYRTYKLRSECPQCGSNMQSRRWARRFGAVTTVLGTLLTGLMLVVLYSIGPSLVHQVRGASVAASRGNVASAIAMLFVLGAVFIFSAGILGYGVWQVATGKRHRRVVRTLIGIITAAALVGLVFAFASDG